MLRQILMWSAMLLGSWASVAQGIVVRSYADALSKAGEKPVVIFAYGADYDKFSTRIHEEYIKKNKIMPAVRKCVFLVVPMYQNPTPAQQKEVEKIMGKHKLPGGIWSYPCLAVVDKDGKLRGIVQGAADMKSVEAASARLNELVEAYITQEKLLSKAASASGSRKADLLLQASNINIAMPDLGDNKGKGDMKDNIGLGARLSFDPIAIVEKLQTMSFAEADAYIRHMIADGCYSRRQRQEMMAAYAGHLRRNNASIERLRALYTEMRNLDPNSMYGAYAEGAIALWVNKESFDPSTVPVELRRSDADVSAVASVPGSASVDTSTNSTKTALGSSSLDDEALPEDEPTESDFEADSDVPEDAQE